MNQLVLSNRFQKDLHKLIKAKPQTKNKIKKALRLIQTNLHHPSLRLHKLEGRSFYSISVDMKLRIILHQENSKLYLLRIGSHDIYKH